MMNYRRITFAAALIGAAAIAAPAAVAAEPRAVIELFTSQGCSSCPPADRLMGELAKDPSLVVLSLPVDYWDYLGWKDTLALHGHTDRERAYSVARGDRDVFTPQVVVNGIAHMVGSDKAAIEKAIVQTHQGTAALTVPVTVAVADGQVTVKLPAAAGESGEVWLCPTIAAVPVEIGRGENRGHTVTYHNVVRRWVKLGVWNGEAQTFTLPLSDLAAGSLAFDDIDRLAVIVQSGVTAKPGVILGAAIASLR